jgi:hypothetical protein
MLRARQHRLPLHVQGDGKCRRELRRRQAAQQALTGALTGTQGGNEYRGINNDAHHGYTNITIEALLRKS